MEYPNDLKEAKMLIVKGAADRPFKDLKKGDFFYKNWLFVRAAKTENGKEIKSNSAVNIQTGDFIENFDPCEIVHYIENPEIRI